MFDKISVGGGTSHSYSNSDITINEHRAPTDESVKLLKELEHEAANNILMTGVVSNILEAQFVVYSNQYFPMRRVLAIGFKLNGEDYNMSVDLPSSLDIRNDPMEVIKLLVEEVCRSITYKLLQNMDKAQMDIMYRDIHEEKV